MITFREFKIGHKARVFDISIAHRLGTIIDIISNKGTDHANCVIQWDDTKETEIFWLADCICRQQEALYNMFKNKMDDRML